MLDPPLVPELARRRHVIHRRVRRADEPVPVRLIELESHSAGVDGVARREESERKVLGECLRVLDRCEGKCGGGGLVAFAIWMQGGAFMPAGKVAGGGVLSWKPVGLRDGGDV